jgi:hypothetical protein
MGSKPLDVNPAEAVPCPKCHAAPWVPCLRSKPGKVHEARAEAWAAELSRRLDGTA